MLSVSVSAKASKKVKAEGISRSLSDLASSSGQQDRVKTGPIRKANSRQRRKTITSLPLADHGASQTRLEQYYQQTPTTVPTLSPYRGTRLCLFPGVCTCACMWMCALWYEIRSVIKQISTGAITNFVHKEMTVCSICTDEEENVDSKKEAMKSGIRKCGDTTY